MIRPVNSFSVSADGVSLCWVGVPNDSIDLVAFSGAPTLRLDVDELRLLHSLISTFLAFYDAKPQPQESES